MPATQRRNTAQSQPPTPSQVSAKYKNKDGSKFITVPKSSHITDSSETSPVMPPGGPKTDGQPPKATAESNGTAPPTVNRKKQKRREKQAAKLAAEQPQLAQANHPPTSSDVQRQMQELEARFREHGLNEPYDDDGNFDPADGEPYYSDEDDYSGSYGPNRSPVNGYSEAVANNPGKKSKKKKKGRGIQQDAPNQPHYGTNGVHQSHPPAALPPLASANMPRGPGISKEKIWNTSSQEERERIKEFWLSLGEDERKSLVKVEKDAVLKKMKEQQKHSCSCTVCGRKRTAIEEELEVLYDAYYEELEQYANHQGDGGPMMPPPRRFGAMSGLHPPNRLPPAFNGQQPSHGRIVEQFGDDDEEEGIDDEYSEDDGEEDDYSDEEPEELPRSHATDFFNFGNSLTVKGGILTVADDLLKNDGKKFIEMMEQLAERRMAREEDAREQYANPNYGHPPNGAMHNHPHHQMQPQAPLPDEEEYDDEEDEEDDYDSQDEDYDEQEMDTMTEEQRMEEGRRMFQIFAARMFEQRVLTAYKEKVAKERQQKLLEELEEENRADSQKKAKKAKDAQKRKDRVQQKKQAVAEEKAKREAERAAEEAAIRIAEDKKAEEQRLKAEEKRKKKEAQKKSEEEERLKKEAEKQRRLQEQRDRQAEQERRQREAKERERKEKEEQRLKEKEAKEAKERELREKKEKQEKDKKEKEAKARAGKEAMEKQRKDEAAQHAAISAAAQAAKRVPVPIPVNLGPHPAAVASPKIPIATPVVPKAPTPIRLRTASQQELNGIVPQTPQVTGVSQNVSPVPSTPLQGNSPGLVGPQMKGQSQHPFLHQPQATSQTHASLKSPPGILPIPFAAMPPMGMGFQPNMPMMAPGFGGRMHHDPMFPYQQQPPMGGQFRQLPGPNSMPLHPMHQMPQGRGFPVSHPPPGFSQQIPNAIGGQPFAPKDSTHPQAHSRQQSASYEKSFEIPTSGGQAQPIARPAPIGRPSSVVHGQRPGHFKKHDIDDLNDHLGSSALLDDSDEPFTSGAGASRIPPALRQNFPPAPFGIEPSPFGNPIPFSNTWGAPPNPFGSNSLPGTHHLGHWGLPTTTSFGAPGPQPLRVSQPRSVAVRLMICRACKNLEGLTSDGFVDIDSIRDDLEHILTPGEQPVSEKELLDICDTEGNAANGGGSFEVRRDMKGHYTIRHQAEMPVGNSRNVGAPGEIGSPIVGGSIPRFAGPPVF